jgi:hypothetical protein
MHRASLWSGLIVSLGVAAVVGCATGTDADGVGEADLLNLPLEAGDENSVVLPPPSNPDSGAGEDTGTGDPDGGTTDAATDSGTDSGTTVSCASPNVCLTATDLGTISGDTGAGTKTFQGSGSQWFKFRVTEDYHGLDGVEQEVRAELQSPTGTDFNLFLYVPGSSTGQECSAVSASSTTTGGFDSTSKDWGETGLFSGGDDDRTVTVEVRHVSGACAPAAKWTLTVRGNTL